MRRPAGLRAQRRRPRHFTDILMLGRLGHQHIRDTAADCRAARTQRHQRDFELSRVTCLNLNVDL
jgi:hypothetical protein